MACQPQYADRLRGPGAHTGRHTGDCFFDSGGAKGSRSRKRLSSLHAARVGSIRWAFGERAFQWTLGAKCEFCIYWPRSAIQVFCQGLLLEKLPLRLYTFHYVWAYWVTRLSLRDIAKWQTIARCPCKQSSESRQCHGVPWSGDPPLQNCLRNCGSVIQCCVRRYVSVICVLPFYLERFRHMPLHLEHFRHAIELEQSLPRAWHHLGDDLC